MLPCTLQADIFKVDDAGNSLPYLLYLPSKYHTGGVEKWPLMLFLHGSSERGENPMGLITHGPVRQAANGAELPFVVVAPQCPAYSTWACEISGVAALVNLVADQYRIDRQRICATGLSMGGTGTWAIAARYPKWFAAIAPICGSWMPEAAERIDRLPVWTFHGEDDCVIPIKGTEEIVDALKERGSPVRFTRYPGVGHDSWTRTYDNPEVYDWLLSHRGTG